MKYSMVTLSLILSVLVFLNPVKADERGTDSVASVFSLAGEWHFQLDSQNIGIEEGWYTVKLTDKIILPGTTDLQQKGKLNTKSEIGRLTRLYPYYGPAWYQKEIEIPEAWEDKDLIFFIELTKASSVWVDSHFIGKQISLTAPHIYNLTPYLTPGKHLLSVRIDNDDNPPVGYPHQISDQTQTNWNGLLGRIELQVKDPVWITGVQVYPDIHKKKVDIEVSFNKNCSGKLILSADAWNTKVQHKVNSKEVQFATSGEPIYSTSLQIGDSMQLWDEFSPALYNLKIDFETELDGLKMRDHKEVNFGMREFSASGTQFQINGKTVFLRGKHDACVFPVTGHVPMDVDEWVRLLRIAKSYGINHYRYHTCTPPEAAFLAADIVGVYMEPQLPRWGQVGDSEQKMNLDDVELKKDTSSAAELVEYMLFEGYKILETFGNHASFCMFTLGNELHGSRDLLSEMVRRFRAKDNRHLYASGSNNFHWGPELSPGDDFWATTFTGGHYTPGNYHPDTKGLDVRSSYPVHTVGQINNIYPNTTYDYSNGIKNVPVPVISHENGQFQVYPDYHEIEKYTGVFRAKNYEIFRERLKDAGMLDQADDFFRASGALSVICYREDIETAIRTEGFGGFQLLDLQDFPGQGTALVGILDVFMDSKGLITPGKWSEFCSEVVPLIRMEKYTWTNDEIFTAKVQLANYGPEEIHSELHWNLFNSSGKTLAAGKMDVNVPQGKLGNLENLSIDLSTVENPQKLSLQLTVTNTSAKNDYAIWVYPSSVNTKAPKGIMISGMLDEKTLKTLEKGGKVLLLPDSSHLKSSIAGAFQSDFWCYPMFKKYSPPGTLGILCNPAHPLFKDFPTEYHSNWQWWALLKNGNAMILDDTPQEFRPVVQVIDNFERNHKLGIIFECNVGKGKLLVCSCNLPEQQNLPEARQLLHSILQYMNSEAFSPAQSLKITELNAIFHGR